MDLNPRWARTHRLSEPHGPNESACAKIGASAT